MRFHENNNAIFNLIDANLKKNITVERIFMNLFMCKPYFVNTRKYVNQKLDEAVNCSLFNCIATKLRNQIQNQNSFVVDENKAEILINADNCHESGKI